MSKAGRTSTYCGVGQRCVSTKERRRSGRYDYFENRCNSREWCICAASLATK